MASIDRQKALADVILTKLQEGGLVPLLAGGAPRDWYIGVAANDLDFYIQTHSRPEDTLGVQRLLDIELAPLGDDKYDKLLREEPSLLAVHEGNFHGQTVQFMFTSVPPKQFVKEKFDLSICKVWYEHGEIGMDWEARLSFREKLIVSENWGEHFDKIMERAEWSHYNWRHNWESALNWMGRKGNRRVGLFDNLAVNPPIFVDDGEPLGVNAVPDPQANEVAF